MITNYIDFKNSEVTFSNLFPDDFHIGALACVSLTEGLPNALLSRPQLSEDDELAWLLPGEIIQILDGPYDDRSMKLWMIKSLARDLVGWTSQGLADTAFLDPVTPRQLCDGSLPSRIQIGYTVRVARTYSLPISLWRMPECVDENHLDSLFSGEKMQVIDGPVCSGWKNQCLLFWQVQLECGITGWVAECDYSTYWLEPMFVRAKAESLLTTT